jgi:hypothetical protein
MKSEEIEQLIRCTDSPPTVLVGEQAVSLRTLDRNADQEVADRVNQRMGRAGDR